MANNLQHKKSSFLSRLLVIALVFLCVGLCLLGSFSGTGKNYELKTKTSSSAEEPAVVFRLSNLSEKQADGTTKSTYLRLRHAYVNVGAAYNALGDAASVRMEIVSSATGTASSSSGRRLELNFSNYAPKATEEGKEPLPGDIFYRWTEVGAPEEGWRVSSYSYVRLTAPTCNLLLNEVVFVGEKLDGSSTSANGTGEMVVIPAEIVSATALIGEGENEAKANARALLDSQSMPSLSNFRFNAFSPSEVPVLQTITEIYAGNSYGTGNVYQGERVYGSLGIDLLAFGTTIFGMSPFGLRFFPMLFAAGALAVGSVLVRRLTRSDRAGLVFAVLFALASSTLALGGLGTPLMMGVFFFLASLDLCHRFYANGMKKVSFSSALPLIGSGLAGACAILTHGALVLPMVGVVALFVLGLVRQMQARRYHLDLAIAEAEAEAPTPVSGEEKTLSPARQKVADVVREYANKRALAIVSFAGALLLGTFVLALLFALPLYYPVIKMYGNPADPSMNMFQLAWYTFAGGFVGTEPVTGTANAWNIFYTLSRVNGESYSAVYGAFLNPVAIVAALVGIAFVVFGITRLVKGKAWGKQERSLTRRLALPVAGLVLTLVTAIFAKDAVLFVLLGWLFLFMLASDGIAVLTSQEGKRGKGCRIAAWVGFGLLAAFFLLYLVFAAGFPVGTGIITAIFG